MNYNLKLLLFIITLTNFSKNFSSAAAAAAADESSQALTIGQKYVFSEISALTHHFATQTDDIEIITTERFKALYSVTQEKNTKITEAFTAKRAAVIRVMNFIHFFIQGTQKSPVVQKILANGNKHLFLNELTKTIEIQEAFLELILKEHAATITALHILHETLESTSE